MPCYHPIPASQERPGQPLRLWPPIGEATLQIPCGKCLGCKTSRATAWSIRAMHEASAYKDNCFLTLTYNDEAVPPNGELDRPALQRFLKRLRKNSKRNSNILTDRTHPIRYLGCGEYGDQTQRPHYHLCLFNCDFADRHKVSKYLDESDTANTLWSENKVPLGATRVGQLTAASATYVAQYTLKKLGVTHCDKDGVVLKPPFLAVSLKPGIGTQWINKYKKDLSHGYIIRDGHKTAIPRTYRKKLHETDKPLAEQVDWKVYEARKPAHQRDDLTAAEVIHTARKRLAEKRTL